MEAPPEELEVPLEPGQEEEVDLSEDLGRPDGQVRYVCLRLAPAVPGCHSGLQVVQLSNAMGPGQEEAMS